MVEKFEIIRGEAEAVIITPFPVCQNVWADFVMKIFPQFQVPVEHLGRFRYNGKHLNRQKDYDEIADGQSADCYRHAYLPHGDRYFPGRVEVSGIIHVPDCRIFYLEQIQADLEENPRTRAVLLDSLRQVHAETVGYLIRQLIKASASDRFKDVKTTKQLRDIFGKQLVERGLFGGCYNDPGKTYCGAYEIEKFPVGQLPLFMRDKEDQNVDFLRNQTSLDFLRTLDDIFRVDRELTEMELIQIPKVVEQKYSDIVRVLII